MSSPSLTQASIEAARAPSRWRDYLRWFRKERRREIDDTLATAFVAEVDRTPELRERFAELCKRFQRDRSNVPYEDRAARNALIGELRRILAHCCVKKMEPDLVILDEFQRFRHLLHGEDDERTREVAELAKELFDYRGRNGERARVLLLSATPYKMYTLAHEGDEDHYRDFLQTCRFLFSSEMETADFERELRAYRAALCLGHDDAAPLAEAKGAVERRLRKVMCRTERLAVSADRNGMLVEIPTPASPIHADDVYAFAWVDHVAATLGATDCVELWKSGAYLVNFMEDYDLKRKIRQAAVRNDALLREALRDTAAVLFRTDAVQRYHVVDLGNARLRALLGDSM